MKRSLFCIVVFMLLTLPVAGFATEEYARQTGLTCAACHADPIGGGELTALGKAFSEGSSPVATPSDDNAAKGFRFAVGYIIC